MSAVNRMIQADGIALHAVSDGRGAPVVLLHGFTGSTSSMAGIAAGLSGRYRTHRIDLVGHGASEAPRDVAPYRMERCVAQVAQVIDALDARPAHIIGYSMGARAALALCARRPESVASAILIGARSGVADPTERARRMQADDSLATRIEDDGVPAFVEHWMALPLFASQRRLGAEALAAARRERLANQAHALAFSLRGMGVAAQPLLDECLSAIEIPICLVVGAEDLRFGAVADSLARALPRAQVVRIPAAGHAAHLENPSAFLSVARRFLNEAAPESHPSPCPPESIPAPTR